MMWRFRSWLAAQFERFVALKRALGFQYRSQEIILRHFDRYIVDHAPLAPLRRETVIAFLATLARLSPRARDNVIAVVWPALDYARLHRARIDSMPPRPPAAPAHFRLRPVRLILREEINSLIAAARCLPPAHHLRPATYATLYGLLFAAGLRIGEAVALSVGDIDLGAGLLRVNSGKFGKSRVLPLRPSTVAALETYLNDPRRPIGTAATAPLFVSSRRTRLTRTMAEKTFKALGKATGIDNPSPRLHDLRHSFTVLCVVNWYRAGRDVNALLPALSTYLGHVSIDNTRTYLQANALLLDEASQRFSAKSAQLDEVLS